MSAIGEAGVGQKTQMHSTLVEGVDVVSNFQTIEFVQYVKVVLPLDGFVFWVRADLVSYSALANAMLLNAAEANAGPQTETVAKVFSVSGDLHYDAVDTQDEATSYVINRVLFTTEEEIKDLNAVGPGILYIGTIDGIKFSFSRHGYLQENAGIFHYLGDAVYAEMETQIIDDPRSLDTRNVVVSNSLPIWLAMSNYQKADWENFGNPSLVLWPSFLVEENLRPPYAAVHIEGTKALGAAPVLTTNLTHYQLATDHVRITTFGLRNYSAQDFVDFVNEQSLNFGLFGLMSSPIVTDAKKTQVELGTLSEKKVIEFDISYNQARVRDVARQLIERAVPSYYVD